MLKVSVVVPAYMPGSGIERVVSSLDAQTMSQQEFEVIIVDDGSPDDTWDRLTALQRTRPNLRLDRIENSGWPSRPRNVALDLALGEYVFFMDHDDSIYPDALRASYEYASRHHADVLSPKELKTSVPTWGVGEFTADRPNAKDERGINSLMPMVPHKFYRREFLLRYGIRFPEGRRKLWEDIYFNIECFKHAEVISILSSTPVYLWHSTPNNNSGSYGPTESSYWDRVEELFAFIVEQLAADEDEPARTTQLVHHYRRRVLGKLSNYVAASERTADWDFALVRALQIIERYAPPSLDERLKPLLRVRSALLRAGELELLAAQTREDRLKPSTATDHASWRDGRLQIRLTTRWRNRDGTDLRLSEVGGRLLRPLPPEVAQVVGVDAVDLTEDVAQAAAQLLLQRRSDLVTWAIRTDGVATHEPAGSGSITPVMRHQLVVDCQTAAIGAPLGSGVWDLRVSCGLAGATGHHPLTTDTKPLPFVSGELSAVAFRTKAGALALDTSGQLRNVIDDGGLTAPANPRTTRLFGRQREVQLRLKRATGVNSGSRPLLVRWTPDEETAQQFGSRLRKQETDAGESGELRYGPDGVDVHLRLPRTDGQFEGELILDGVELRSRVNVAMHRGKCERATVQKR